MAATYPTAIKSFTTFTDYVDFDAAAHINELHDEIGAVESTLGPNPHLLHDASHIPGTLGHVLDQMDTNITTVLNRTTNPWATVLAGPTSGYYINATTASASGGASLQAYNGTNVARLILNPNGGDLLIGSNSNVSISGSLSTTAGITCSTLTASSLNIAGTISAPNFTIDSPGGALFMGNGNSIHPGGTTNGAGVTVYDGDESLSQHTFNGHVQMWAGRQFNTQTGWASAVLALARPSDTNASLSFWSYYSGGVSVMFGFNGDQMNQGFQCWDGTPGTAQGSVFVPVEASAFLTRSTAASKAAIEDLPHGLSTVVQLRPVHFLRPRPGFSPGRRQADGTVFPDDRVSTDDLAFSRGDEKRFSTRHHGLIAEEVHDVLPEVVHLDHDGKPVAIDYGSLVPLLVNAIKELAAKVENLERKGTVKKK